MADVWTYDAATSLTDTFTPEDPLDSYVLIVDFEGLLDSAGPGAGPFTLTATLTGAAPAGDFFNATRYSVGSGLPVALGLFLQGTANLYVVSFDALAYDGASTVSTIVHSSNPLYEYAIGSNDPASTITWFPGNGGDLPVAVADVGGLAAGDPFAAHLLIHVIGGGGFGAFAALDSPFEFGTAGGGGEDEAMVVFDGGALFKVAP